VILDVAPLPDNVRMVASKVAIVVDALRASATLTALFDSGAQSVLVAAGPADAIAVAGQDRSRYLICGEVGGVAPVGFDHGNSPTEIADLDLAGREVILSTSNGTRALRAVADARLTLVGTGRNGASLIPYALAQAANLRADLTIVCAGDDGGQLFSLEDFFFAGYLVELAAALQPFTWPVDESDPGAGEPGRWVLDESAVAARRLYRSYLPTGVDPSQPPTAATRAALEDARNGHSLPRIGYAADLDYCAQVSCSRAVPRLGIREGRYLLTDDQA
jgi:2-phosphosulfolactate phosphatase